MFARSRDEMIPRIKATIGAQTIILTIFFSSMKLVSLSALPSGARLTQEYFINSILTDIVNEMGKFSKEFVEEIILFTRTIHHRAMGLQGHPYHIFL
jgi:NADH:ubiquinone oxidoreductase subunit D